MDSESELLSEMETNRKLRNKKLKKLKNNRVASPDIHSLQSVTPSETSIEMDVFIARKPPKKREKPSDEELSTARTSDDLETEISEDPSQSLQTSDKFQGSDSKDSKSYRDKLKQRFLSVKQLSSQNLENTLLKKFKSRSQNVENLNKCIETLRNENHSINLQLKSHKPYVYQGIGGEVSNAEKYQFFCEIFDGDNLWESEENKLENDESPVDFKPTENFKSLLEKSYEDIIWIPRKHNITRETNDSDDLETETVDKETKEPKMPQRHLKLLKQRLLAADNREFFNASDEIIYDKSNYAQTTYRPLNYDNDNPFTINYEKPKSFQHFNSDIMSVFIEETRPTLDINLQSLRFTKHPLFTSEHLLQEELIRLIDVHKSQKHKSLLKSLQNLRQTKKEQLHLQKASGDNNHYLDNELLKEIKTTREDFYEESRLFRENVKRILHTWKKLKKLREDSGYSKTTIKLIILRNSSGYYEDPREVFEEIRMENEIDYEEKMKVYKEKLQIWKTSREQRKNKGNPENVEVNDGIREDDNEIEEDEEEKPLKPPRLLNSKKIQTKIEDCLKKSFGDQNEPNLIFNVDYSELTEVNLTEEEKNRRNSLKNTTLRLKLLLGKLPICKTKIYELSQNFTLSIDENFSIVLEQPEDDQKITVELRQTRLSGLKDVLLSKMEVPIPKLSEIHGHTNFQEVFFTSSSPDKTLIGILTFCIGWSPPPKDGATLQNVKTDCGENAICVGNLQKQGGKKENGEDESSKKHFRLDPYLESFTIASKEEIVNNVRLKLLELRDKNEPEFVGMAIPLRIKEIPSNIFATYNRRLADAKYQYFDKPDDVDDDIVGKRSLGRKVLRQLHTNVFQICRNCENNLCFDDVVDEKMVPWIQNYLKTILKNCLNWFKFQPNLAIPLPLLEMQSEINNVVSHHQSTVKIKIELKSGIHLKENSKHQVDVTYSKTLIKSGESNLSHGKHTWNNEILELPIAAENFDYLNPQSLSGVILVRLFQLSPHEDVPEDNIEDSNCRTYVGCVEIPIAAVSDTKMEGEFPVESPVFVYGYEKEEREERTQQGTTPRIQPKSLAFLEMSLYAECTIPKIHADLSSITSSEPPFLRDHILQWNNRFNNDHPRRKFNALAMDHNGKTVCLTRYIKALEPPKLNTDEFDVSLEQCARFVSLLPFSKANKFYENVWITGEQLLKLGIGTVQDHATLLTCYLLSLKMDVWLLLGFGIPHGNTAYVLLREYNDTPLPNHYIIDVTNGAKFNVTDLFCPLRKIYCVVNEHNIWANTQRGDAIFTTRFDFTRRFDWLPLFNETISAPSNSQQTNLHYLHSGDAPKLQQTLERKLLKKISTLRDQDVTIWNHYYNKLLREQISKAERNFMHGKPNLPASSQILEFSKTYKINGTIQCLQFTSINDVIDKVLRSEVWQITQQNEEFACCVHVHSYVNQVIAVWVALVVLVKHF